MNIQNISIEEIRPYWRNPRNNESAIDAVKKSIQEYGFNQPIVTDKDLVIIAGHTRYKALLQLGWKEAPVVVLEDIAPEKAKQYRIADNKTNELASWDMSLLIPELREIKDLDVMRDYFPEFDLDALLHEASTAAAVTTEQIEHRQEKMENAFQERSEEAADAYISVTCPHCGEDFFVDKREVNRFPGKPTAE